MEDSLEPSRCDAKTRTGNLCRKYPTAGTLRYRLHGSLSTGPKTAAGKARIAKAQLKHGKFVNWRERRAKEKFYYKRIRMVIAQARDAGLIED